MCTDVTAEGLVFVLAAMASHAQRPVPWLSVRPSTFHGRTAGQIGSEGRALHVGLLLSSSHSPCVTWVRILK